MDSTTSKFSTDNSNLASKTQKTFDTVTQTAGNAIENTREFANDNLSKAEDKVRTLRENIDPMVDKLTAQAQKLARQSLDMAAQARDRAQQSMTRATDATSRYVSDQPLRSILIAAGVGAVVALMIAATRNRNQY